MSPFWPNLHDTRTTTCHDTTTNMNTQSDHTQLFSGWAASRWKLSFVACASRSGKVTGLLKNITTPQQPETNAPSFWPLSTHTPSVIAKLMESTKRPPRNNHGNPEWWFGVIVLCLHRRWVVLSSEQTIFWSASITMTHQQFSLRMFYACMLNVARPLVSCIFGR